MLHMSRFIRTEEPNREPPPFLAAIGNPPLFNYTPMDEQIAKKLHQKHFRPDTNMVFQLKKFHSL